MTFAMKGGQRKLWSSPFGEASLRSALPLRGLPASQGDGLRSATLPLGVASVTPGELALNTEGDRILLPFSSNCR
jgi:hypothetical protein